MKARIIVEGAVIVEWFLTAFETGCEVTIDADMSLIGR